METNLVALWPVDLSIFLVHTRSVTDTVSNALGSPFGIGQQYSRLRKVLDSWDSRSWIG